MTSFSYALAQTKKLNEFILKNPALAKEFIFGDYNFLQVYQQLIFTDFKFFYENKTLDSSLLVRSSHNLNLRVLMRRLLSVTASFFGYLFLILSRRELLIFSTDKISFPAYQCDFRMANLYRQLKKNQIKFLEIFHSNLDENFGHFLLLRKRPVIYLEAIDFFYKIFSRLGFLKKDDSSAAESADLSSFGEEEEFVRLLLKKYLKKISQTKFLIIFLKILFKLTNVKILITPFDSRYYHATAEACRLNKIKTYAFQSGVLSKYNVSLIDCSSRKGNIIKPDKFFLSSRYWIEELLRLDSIFDREDLAIGGDVKEDRSVASDMDAMAAGKEVRGITVLVSYETEAIKSEVRAYIEKFLECSDTRVIFSLRPDRNEAAQLEEYGLQNMPGNFSTTKNLSEAIKHIDVVAGTQSTLLYDLVGYLKPILILKTEMDMFEGMVINGLAEELDINESNFCERLRAAKETAPEILARRKAKLYESAVPLDKTLKEILFIL